MGIVNVTPDSFYDGGRYRAQSTAFEHALQLIREGADIIDIGGESTRPGALPVSIQEECDRVLPLLEKLIQETAMPISVDTRHAVVMQEAIRLGASIINDVAALTQENALEVVSKHPVKVCLMHMQGLPETMQQKPHYENILEEINAFFVERLQACEQAGLSRQRIWLDPGFGFGKTLEHNLMLLGNLSFFQTLGCPLLVGLSRKSMFGALLNRAPEQRLPASLSAALIASLQGVACIRTHDVAATRDALSVMKAVQPHCKETLSVRTA
ncbi:dihydropteroate synthase [Candidatus Berkiella aquae]|nr:dihydropteroate synthase [Candidatus Berkiella aquae]